MRPIKFDAAKFQITNGAAWLMLRIPPVYRLPARGLPNQIEAERLYVAEIKPYREKRSLDANAYFWLLCGKLAAATGIPKREIYREYVREIGDNFEVVPVREDAASRWVKNWEGRGSGWQCENLGPAEMEGYINYACYYGSSTYDTQQMGHLIDLVIADCKDQEIETATPEEVARMKARWADAQADKSV